MLLWRALPPSGVLGREPTPGGINRRLLDPLFRRLATACCPWRPAKETFQGRMPADSGGAAASSLTVFGRGVLATATRGLPTVEMRGSSWRLCQSLERSHEAGKCALTNVCGSHRAADDGVLTGRWGELASEWELEDSEALGKREASGTVAAKEQSSGYI